MYLLCQPCMLRVCNGITVPPFWPMATSALQLAPLFPHSLRVRVSVCACSQPDKMRNWHQMYNTMPEVAPIKCAVRESAVRTKKIHIFVLGNFFRKCGSKRFFHGTFYRSDLAGACQTRFIAAALVNDSSTIQGESENMQIVSESRRYFSSVPLPFLQRHVYFYTY